MRIVGAFYTPEFIISCNSDPAFLVAHFLPRLQLILGTAVVVPLGI